MVPTCDVDTDMIFHNKHLHIVNPVEMGKFIFGNLKGYESFPASVQTGDILIVGHNFGAGSSRQQAVDGFIALGVQAVIGKSFGAIYKRNAINAGWPLIECETILEAGLREGDLIEVDLEKGIISDLRAGSTVVGKPMTQVQLEIYQAGGLLHLV